MQLQVQYAPLSEYTYYENILLGLPKILRQCVGITNMSLKRKRAVSSADIQQWENKNGVILPEPMRNLYLASNGYSFKYQYVLSEGNAEESVTGKVYINSLENLNQVYGYETTNDSGVKYDGERYVIRLAPQSKVFELDLLPDRGKVVLVYLFPEFVPKIWLLTVTMGFYFLSDNIFVYLRMCIAHLGIPNWQLAYSPLEFPQWTENMFRMMAPNLLPLSKKIENTMRGHPIELDNNEECLNRIDSAVFRIHHLRPNRIRLFECDSPPILTAKLSEEGAKDVVKTRESSNTRLRRSGRKRVPRIKPKKL